ncbi:MAG: hypothetical protein GEU90_05435 [Gemmatimonas sp.]|nr:hypothetical protein [Gemmatimonas sp.]
MREEIPRRHRRFKRIVLAQCAAGSAFLTALLLAACSNETSQLRGKWFDEAGLDEIGFLPESVLLLRFRDSADVSRVVERSGTYRIVRGGHLRVSSGGTNEVFEFDLEDDRLKLVGAAGDTGYWRRGDSTFLSVRDSLLSAAWRLRVPDSGYRGFNEGEPSLRELLRSIETGGAHYRLTSLHPHGLVAVIEVTHDAAPDYSCVARKLASHTEDADVFLNKYYEKLYGRPAPQPLVPWDGIGRTLLHRAELETLVGWEARTMAEGREAFGDSIVCDLIGLIYVDR